MNKNKCASCGGKLTITEYYTGEGHIIWKMKKDGTKSKHKIDSTFYSRANNWLVQCDKCDKKASDK